jgi:hypothetical protein
MPAERYGRFYLIDHDAVARLADDPPRRGRPRTRQKAANGRALAASAQRPFAVGRVEDGCLTGQRSGSR